MNANKLLLALIGCLAFGTAHADATKTLKYIIDHTSLAGYTDNPPEGYRQVISIRPISNRGAYAHVYQQRLVATPNLPNPQRLTIFNQNGTKISEEVLPIQVEQSDCTLPRKDENDNTLFDTCPFLFYTFNDIQGQRNHYWVLVQKQQYDNTTGKSYWKKYSYILDIAKSGDKRWTQLDSTTSDSVSFAIWQNTTPSYPLVYVVTDQSAKKTFVYKLAFH